MVGIAEQALLLSQAGAATVARLWVLSRPYGKEVDHAQAANQSVEPFHSAQKGEESDERAEQAFAP